MPNGITKPENKNSDASDYDDIGESGVEFFDIVTKHRR